jgi:glycogen debranching enzyme
MDLSLSAAARATGRSKSTIGRAIKSGKLSARRGDTGGYLIDASELARAFDWDPSGPVPWSATAPLEPIAGPSVPVEVLEAKLALLEQALGREREALAHERETTADLRQRLDRSDERVRALLPQGAPALTPAPARGLLARFLRR